MGGGGEGGRRGISTLVSIFIHQRLAFFCLSDKEQRRNEASNQCAPAGYAFIYP